MLRSLVTSRISWALAGLLLLAVLVPIGLGRSEAAFVASSNNPNSVFSSASSFNTVAVTLTNPGTPLHGTVVFNAVATSDRGISSVVFQTRPAGASTWTTVCTDNGSPYSCTWDTTGVADGLRDIRAVATDTAGYSLTDTVTDRRIDNTAPTATTTDPGSPLTGTVSVTGVGSDLGSGVASTTVQYHPPGGGSWTDICTQAGGTATCSWNTALLADGLYDLQTIATDLAGNTTTTSTVVASRSLDNNAPSATMTPPASILAGTVTLASTSSDAANGTGVASVRYEYRLNGGSNWNPACTGSIAPFSCSFATTSAGDGVWDFRAVAIDGVGKQGASTPVTLRRIDNTAPALTMGALPNLLPASVSLTSTVSELGSGIASPVQYQYKLISDSTWTNACSSSSSTPYPCSFTTTALADGLYDFRVQATDNAGNTGTSTPVFSRRIDNTAPTVTMGALAAWVDGTITLTSTPSDGGGIASVQYEYRVSPSGGWTSACPPATSPYTCSFSTTSLTNGTAYDFRVIATDNAARTATSAVVTSRIDHANPTITMTTPAAAIGGTVTLASTPADSGSGVASVQYQYRVATTGTWTNACPSSSTPFSCAFNTAPLTDGLYDFQAIVTDKVGRTATSATITGRLVDNTSPATVTLAAVGTPLSGSVNFTGTATDNTGGSGIASWKVQYSPVGAGTWTDLCTDTAPPFGACTGSVNAIADGLYDFRAVATDAAGNTLSSPVQTNRRIDTGGPVTSITSPANNARVRGTITMVAAASDPVGVASVQFQYQAAPGVWVTICTDNTPSYTCQGDTTQVADGTYQIRVIATDTLTHPTTSALTTLIVDNTPASGTNVQAANGGTVRSIDSGDTLTFTWNDAMAPASILSGWTGASQAIRVRLNRVTGGNNDTLDLYDSTGNTKLNITSATQALRLNADYAENGTVWLNANLVMTGNSAVVTMGSVISGTPTTGVNRAAAMQWTTTAASTDLAGNATNVATITESGGNDQDF